MGCGCGKKFNNNAAARAARPASTNNVSGRQIVQQQTQARVVRSQNFAQPSATTTGTPPRRTV